jgi:predicted permease
MPDFAFTRERRLEVLNMFLDRVRALPGASHVGFTTGLPLINSETIAGFTMKSVKPPAGAEIQVHTVRSVVTDDYFTAIGMRTVTGRGFTSGDTAASPKVVVVNRAFARQYLTDRAIGDHVANFATGDNVEYEVVGVVDDVLKHSVSDPAQPEIYSLNRQMSSRTFDPNLGSLVIRTSGDPRALVEALRQIASEADRSLTLESIVTMEERVATALAKPRLYANLLGTFAASAVVIASVGLFGLLSYSVGQRKREIAIRSALGATRGDIGRFVFRQSASVTIAGLVIGIGLSLAVVGYLSTLLYGVTIHDGLSFVAVPLVIAIVASVATLSPAVRATRVDPMSTIRSV